MPRILILLCLLLLPTTSLADEIRLNCTADTSLSSYPSEAEFNYGSSSRLRLKGIQSVALLKFDLDPSASWKIDRATLHLRYSGADRKLKTVGLSTVSAPWSEGTGTGARLPGQVSFAWRETGKTPWAGTLTDVTDVCFTSGNTLASYANVQELPDGWISVDVDPRIVQAMIAGESFGMAVTDEKGQTNANNDVYSREQSNSQPYLVVTGAPSSVRGPAAVGNLTVTAEPSRSGLSTGAARISFDPASGAFCYRVRYAVRGEAVEAPRYKVPFPSALGRQSFVLDGLPVSDLIDWIEVIPVSLTGAPGQPSRTGPLRLMAKARPRPLSAPPVLTRAGVTRSAEIPGLVRVWAYPEGTKAHPVSGNLLEEVGAERYAGQTAGVYREKNLVWEKGTVQLSAARNEIVSFNLAVEKSGTDKIAATVSFDGKLHSSSGSLIEVKPEIFRTWYVKDGDWQPEAAVPLKGTLSVPADDNEVPSQRNQTVSVDLVIPRSAAPGRYSGSVSIIAASRHITVPIEIAVNGLTLPDTLSFDVSLNAYGTVGFLFGIDDRTPEYRALEREYHRMAHRHRTTLAILGYSHSNRISTNYAPPLTGERKSLRVADWASWDAQFGPYLDGSAFAGLPRAGVPVTHLYLPFNEAWPADISKHYHYAPAVLDYPATITEHALKAAAIEEAMDERYADEFASVMREFNRHFHEKGWTRTDFQFYLNDKNYYKDPKQGGQGTSWWLLDEPNYRDDWLALAYFGRLYRKATHGEGPIHFREDVSRPEWQRDYLSGLVDLMVVGGALYSKQPLLKEFQRNEHVRYWTYGTANSVRASNLEAEGWAIQAWLGGADGIVPWNSIGTDRNYVEPDATALLLPGKRFGFAGPVASMRLKALRRAQQDIEYLVLLGKAKGWDRDQVAAALATVLQLKSEFRQSSPEDAGKVQFAALRAETFDAMRRAVASSLP